MHINHTHYYMTVPFYPVINSIYINSNSYELHWMNNMEL